MLRTTLPLAFLLLGMAACSGEGSTPPRGPIQSESELMELTGFITPGETTTHEVLAHLGEAFFTLSHEEGGSSLGFILESVPFVLEDGESRVGIFAPERMESSRNSVEASIWIEIDPEGRVAGYSVRGPKP